MTSYSDLIILSVIVVAFIAGYSIVSYIVKKFKAWQLHTIFNNQNQQTSGPVFEETSDQKSGTRKANQQNQQGDQFRDWERGKTGRRQEDWDTLTEDQKQARVLGLRGRIIPSDIKKAYRELLTKYHPDKVNHLGDEFKKIAELKTREIIVAYDYFRVKYDIR
jgi:hypothetical protein